jgi:hypothetical protein
MKLAFTIFNPANEKDAFAVGFSTTQYEPAAAAEYCGFSVTVASGGGYWTTFSLPTF